MLSVVQELITKVAPALNIDIPRPLEARSLQVKYTLTVNFSFNEAHRSWLINLVWSDCAEVSKQLILLGLRNKKVFSVESTNVWPIVLVFRQKILAQTPDLDSFPESSPAVFPQVSIYL